MTNASALFRSLLVYGLCLPLAVYLGYLLANPLDSTTQGVVLVVLLVLAIPLFLRWHHLWLIAAWNATALLFFVPGKPQVWIGLAAVSLTMSILQYALNRNMKFLSVPSVARPLLLLAAVILVTARITGGISFRLFGGDTYGGRNYVELVAAVVGYFAIINRRIPAKRAFLYVALFFLGAGTMAIANLPGVINPAFNFLFMFFPVQDVGALAEQNSVVVAPAPIIGRVAGLGPLGLAVLYTMLARYGIRGVLDTSKPWRFGVFCFFILVCMGGGFRGGVITICMILALLFYVEGLHHTRLLVPVVFGFLAVVGLLGLFASRLPLALQRSLAVVPFIEIDPLVRLDADSSTGWRLEMWRDVLPEVPQYLLVGKGYSFSGSEQKALRNTLASAELVGNYHNGPLSVIIPFGLLGAISFVWLLVAGIRVLHQNYQFGDPAYHQLNTFLFAYFVTKVVFFFLVFGSFHSDFATFLGALALSISLNGGAAKPAVVPQPKLVFNRFKLHPSVRRPVGA
jgi:hypothetical protein